MEFLSHATLFIAFQIFSSFYSCLSSLSDTITSARPITDPETVTSSNSDFKLGFFTPPNSTNRYVGLWYLSESNIVWVANRDQPLKDSSGVVKIHEDGNLVILNSQNDIIWSTNVSLQITNSSAQIDDSGNLILRDETTGMTMWESFQHPCDALILGHMRISANKITGKKTVFTSWKTPSDPSSGYYTSSLERLDAPEIFQWFNGTRPHWRSGPWNRRVFIGISNMATEYMFGWNMVHDNDGTVYLSYSFGDPFASGIIHFTSNGRLKLVVFNEKNEVLINEVNYYDCDSYGNCGPFGSCDKEKSPICSCLPGFEPANEEEWSRKNWTRGCVRKASLQCGRLNNESSDASDGFLVLANMKVPDFLERSDADQDKCRANCSANCSCLAYAYDAGVGCMQWSRDLIDLQKFQSGGVDLHIRVPHSELGKRTGHKRTIIAVSGAIGAIILAASAYIWWRKWTAKHKGNQHRNMITKNQSEIIKVDDLPLFDFGTLVAATENFNSRNMLGRGGFGQVYKGQLEDSQRIAVKRLSKASGQGLEEFMNEVIVISKLQHRNLVRLLGCCIEGDEQMLVYELMPNKSLDAFIFDPNQRKVLDWKKRFNIIEGIARGLLYLHRDSRLRIIHRDLKASNILLDEEMNPKISDFGLAKVFGGGENDEANTKRVVGTFGYMPPEYAMQGIFSEKSDIYSFGVLLLEIVSGRRSSSFYNKEQSCLVENAWKLWNEGEIISLIDPEIQDPCFESSILRCIHIGLLCVQQLTRERPTMATIVLMLTSEITHLPPIGQVAFVHSQNFPSLRSSTESGYTSKNQVTVSEIQGR